MAVRGVNRVIRGGSWNNNAQNLRSANRNNRAPGNHNSNVGLRLVSTSDSPDKRRLRIALPCTRHCPGRDPVLADLFLSDE